MQAAYEAEARVQTEIHNDLLKTEIFVRLVDKGTGMWLGPLYGVMQAGRSIGLGEKTAGHAREVAALKRRHHIKLVQKRRKLKILKKIEQRDSRASFTGPNGTLCEDWGYSNLIQGINVVSSQNYGQQPQNPQDLDSDPSWITPGGILTAHFNLMCTGSVRSGNGSFSTKVYQIENGKLLRKPISLSRVLLK